MHIVFNDDDAVFFCKLQEGAHRYVLFRGRTYRRQVRLSAIASDPAERRWQSPAIAFVRGKARLLAAEEHLITTTALSYF